MSFSNMGLYNNFYPNYSGFGRTNSFGPLLTSILQQNNRNYYDSLLKSGDLSPFYRFDFSNPYALNQSLNRLPSNSYEKPIAYDSTYSTIPFGTLSSSNSPMSKLFGTSSADIARELDNLVQYQQELEEAKALNNQADRLSHTKTDQDNSNIENSDNDSKRSKSSSKLVEIAKHQLGKKESDESYLKFTDGNKEGSWCAAFVTWCLRKNGHHVKGDSEGRNSNWDCDALASNIFKSNPDAVVFDRESGDTSLSGIKPGSVIFFSKKHSNNNFTHVGIVEKIKNGKIYTIEGNTTNKVGRRVYDADDEYVQTILKV